MNAVTCRQVTMWFRYTKAKNFMRHKYTEMLLTHYVTAYIN